MNWRRLWAIMLKELRQMRRDRVTLAMILGIPVLLRYEAAGRIFGITLDGLGKVRVMVPRRLLAEARQVLADKPDEAPAAIESTTTGQERPH